MRISALRYEFRRIMGKLTRLDPRSPLPRNLQIGPLSYTQWNKIMDHIFQACQKNSNIVLAYKLRSLDELLTFDREQAIKRGMPIDYSKITVFAEVLPNIDQRWSPFIELWPMLTRKAAEKLGTEKGKPWEALSKSSGLFLTLRTLEAKNNLHETVTRDEITNINKACQFFGVDFTFSA